MNYVIEYILWCSQIQPKPQTLINPNSIDLTRKQDKLFLYTFHFLLLPWLPMCYIQLCSICYEPMGYCQLFYLYDPRPKQFANKFFFPLFQGTTNVHDAFWNRYLEFCTMSRISSQGYKFSRKERIRFTLMGIFLFLYIIIISIGSLDDGNVRSYSFFSLNRICIGNIGMAYVFNQQILEEFNKKFNGTIWLV